jgi:hypothetical protein
MWKKYFVRDGTDWWAPLYPPDNFKRPTGPLCDGCHSVNYDIATKKVSEWNVGCEKCHGPGSAMSLEPLPMLKVVRMVPKEQPTTVRHHNAESPLRRRCLPRQMLGDRRSAERLDP